VNLALFQLSIMSDLFRTSPECGFEWFAFPVLALAGIGSSELGAPRFRDPPCVPNCPRSRRSLSTSRRSRCASTLLTAC